MPSTLVLRLPLAWRDSPERIAQLPIQADSSRYLPLTAVSDVREAKGPRVIFCENGQRRFTIAIKPSVRDVGTLVNQFQNEVAAKVMLPEGYFITSEGKFQAQCAMPGGLLLFISIRVCPLVDRKPMAISKAFRWPFKC